jgi:hypothetical protein
MEEKGLGDRALSLFLIGKLNVIVNPKNAHAHAETFAGKETDPAAESAVKVVEFLMFPAPERSMQTCRIDIRWFPDCS